MNDDHRRVLKILHTKTTAFGCGDRNLKECMSDVINCQELIVYIHMAMLATEIFENLIVEVVMEVGKGVLHNRNGDGRISFGLIEVVIRGLYKKKKREG